MSRFYSVVLGASCLVAGSVAFMPPAPAAPLRKGVAMQAAVRGSAPAGNGRKVLQHYIKKLKEGGYPEKAADNQFKDYSDRELDAMFDLTVDEYDKMVEDAYNQLGPFQLTSADLDGLIDEAFVASEGGEKARPLGIEADHGGAEDVLLITGRAFEQVASKLSTGGAVGEDGHKFLFLTPDQLNKFNQDIDNLVKEIEKKFDENMAPIDAKIAHWEKEFKTWESDPIKYTDLLAEMPEGLEGDELLAAFPGYEPYADTWSDN